MLPFKFDLNKSYIFRDLITKIQRLKKKEERKKATAILDTVELNPAQATLSFIVVFCLFACLLNLHVRYLHVAEATL